MSLTLKTAWLALVSLVFALNPIAADARELTVAFPFGPKNPVYRNVLMPFADALEDLSKGELTVKIFPGGALNSDPRMQYAILTRGVADIAYVLPGHTGDLFPITNTISLPNLAASAVDGTDKLWNVKSLIDDEFDGRILALWSGPPSVLLTRDRPVRNLADVQGLKIRVASSQEAVFTESFGASPVAQPAILANQNLANGVIDGISIGAGAIPVFHLDESAKYVTRGVPSTVAPFVLLMNQAVYLSLTDLQRKWIDKASGKALSQSAALAFDAFDARAFAYARKRGLELIDLPDAEAAKFETAIAGALDKVLMKQLKNSLTIRDVVARMRGE